MIPNLIRRFVIMAIAVPLAAVQPLTGGRRAGSLSVAESAV